MQMTQAMFLQDKEGLPNKDTWLVVHDFLKPLATRECSLKPRVATWPLPSEASASSSSAAAPTVHGLPLQRLPLGDKKFPHCTWLPTMGMMGNANDGDDENPLGP